MCGRFTVTFDPAELEDELGLEVPPPHLPPRYNVAPTQPVAAVPNLRPRRLDLFHWGLIPWWSKDRKIAQRMINARAETLATRGAFKEALQKRRCLIPADGFYEWQRSADKKRKQPFLIRRKGGAPFAFAGLWDEWTPRERGAEGHDGPGGHDKVKSLTIVTTRPNALVAPIHDRMPVMLLPIQYETWLDPELTLVDATRLLTAIPAEELELIPVSSHVGNPKHDDPECIAAIDPAALAHAVSDPSSAKPSSRTRRARTPRPSTSKQLTLFDAASPPRKP